MNEVYEDDKAIITCLGDSTLDYEVWVEVLVTSFFQRPFEYSERRILKAC